MEVQTENKGKLRVPTTTIVAMVKMNKNKTFKNYYWLGGPQPSDREGKVTVIHYGQTQQYANCLLTADEGCPALGIGKKL